MKLCNARASQTQRRWRRKEGTRSPVTRQACNTCRYDADTLHHSLKDMQDTCKAMQLVLDGHSSKHSYECCTCMRRRGPDAAAGARSPVEIATMVARPGRKLARLGMDDDEPAMEAAAAAAAAEATTSAVAPAAVPPPRVAGGPLDAADNTAGVGPGRPPLGVAARLAADDAVGC